MEKYLKMQLDKIKQRLLLNWTLWRITRLALSLVFIVNGIIKLDYILLVGGVFLLGHALINACATCAGVNCEITQNKTYE
jgi:hypothetical protein